MAFNKKFNLKRFGLLIKQDWHINKRMYILQFLLWTVMFFFIFTSFLLGDKDKSYIVRYNYEGVKTYKTLANFLFMAMLSISVSNLRPFANKNTAANYLLTPGSALEKLLASFFIRVVVFTTFLIGIFVLMIDANLALLTSGKINSTTYFDAGLMPRFQFQYLVRVNNQCRLWNWLVVLNLYSLATLRMSFPFISKIKTTKPKITIFFVLIFFVGAFIAIEKFNFSKILPKVYAVTPHFTNLAIFGLAIIPTTAFTTFLMAYYFLKEREVK